MGGTNDKSI
jgi:hypothetical protein